MVVLFFFLHVIKSPFAAVKNLTSRPAGLGYSVSKSVDVGNSEFLPRFVMLLGELGRPIPDTIYQPEQILIGETPGSRRIMDLDVQPWLFNAAFFSFLSWVSLTC